MFIYNDYDLRVFYLTRRLAALKLEKRDYQAQFGIPEIQDFSSQLAVLINANLMKDNGDSYIPTPEGMFYADTIASLFAEKSKASFPRNQKGYLVLNADKTPQVSNMAGHM